MAEHPTKELVRKFVHEHDPESLLKSGCPEDEYDHEIDMICDAVEQYKPTNFLELSRIICNIWHQQFGSLNELPVMRPEYVRLAEAIWYSYPRTSGSEGA